MRRPLIIKSICVAPYVYRGRLGKYHKWHIKNKTPFGLWVVQFRLETLKKLKL